MGTQYDPCPSCDGPVKTGSRFCSTCGAEFDPVEETKVPDDDWLRGKLVEFGVIADGDNADGGEEGEGNGNGEPAKPKRTIEIYD